MSSAIKNSKMAIAVTATLALTACGKTQMVRGYIFDQEIADAIQPGVDNRQSVSATLGGPTIRATFDDNIWYYVSTRVRVRPVFWPDAKAHRVLAITFNDSGVVSDVRNFGMEDRREINPVKDKTPTRGRELNVFQQIFLNVGRFSGAAPVGSGGGPNSPNG